MDTTNFSRYKQIKLPKAFKRYEQFITHMFFQQESEILTASSQDTTMGFQLDMVNHKNDIVRTTIFINASNVIRKIIRVRIPFEQKFHNT